MEGSCISLRRAASVLCAIVLITICVFNMNVPDKAYSDGGAEKPISDIANDMAVKINEARAELGLKPLYVVSYLNDVANTRVTTFVPAERHGTLLSMRDLCLMNGQMRISQEEAQMLTEFLKHGKSRRGTGML